MTKARKTSRQPTAERVYRARPDLSDTAEKIGQARLAQKTAERTERMYRAVAVQQEGADLSEEERFIHGALDAPVSDFGEGAAEARAEYQAAVAGRALAARAGELSFAELRRPIDPRAFERRDTSAFAETKRRADEAQRADYVYKTPEAPMYVPAAGEKAMGAPGSIKLGRREPLSEPERQAAEDARRGVEELPYSEIERGATGQVDRALAEIGDDIGELDKVLDRAVRMREQLAASRNEPVPVGDVTDAELAYAIERFGPARKAVAGRFAAAARGKIDAETGETIFEGAATRYAMQPALAGALKSAYKASRRARIDPNLRNIAAAAQAMHLLMKLRGEHSRFDAMVRRYLSASKRERDGYGYGRMRLDIFLLAKEAGFAVPTELGKWPSAELLHKRWMEAAKERD